MNTLLYKNGHQFASKLIGVCDEMGNWTLWRKMCMGKEEKTEKIFLCVKMSTFCFLEDIYIYIYIYIYMCVCVCAKELKSEERKEKRRRKYWRNEDVYCDHSYLWLSVWETWEKKLTGISSNAREKIKS